MITLVVTFLIGTAFGAFVMSLAVAARRGDEARPEAGELGEHWL